MATIEQIQSALDQLITPPAGLDFSTFLPSKIDVIKGLLGKSIPGPEQEPGESTADYQGRVQEYQNGLTEMAQQSASSFFGAQVDMEMTRLKTNLTSFMSTVPSLASSIVAQITAVSGNPYTINCVPSLVSGIKSQIGLLTNLASQILGSCVFLNIEIPDAVLTMIQTLGTLKTALDNIPV